MATNNITVTVHPNRIVTSTPFNTNWVNEAREKRGSWDAVDKSWSFSFVAAYKKESLLEWLTEAKNRYFPNTELIVNYSNNDVDNLPPLTHTVLEKFQTTSEALREMTDHQVLSLYLKLELELRRRNV